MKLEGEFIFNGSRQVVWDLLQDPDVLANCIPGTKKLEKKGEDEFESTTEIRIGPLNGIFTNRMTLKDKSPPQSYTILVDSNSSQGFAKGSANVELVEQDANSTLLKYDAELQVGGRLAGVGQRMLDTVGKSLTRQGLEAMNKALQSRIRTSSDSGNKYTPPTQAEFASGVFKDVVRDSFLSRRGLWIAAAMVLIVIIVLVLISIGR